MKLTFLPPGQRIDTTDSANDALRPIELPDDACADLDDDCRPGAGGRLVGAIARLPIEDGPLAYRNTLPGGEVPPCSTLSVRVGPDADDGELWTECPSLVHSLANNNHFVVETDELGHSLIRFGDGRNGRGLPERDRVHVEYQVGWPLDGNVGADAITNLIQPTAPLLDNATVRNPFDVTDGRAPEPVAEIVRRIPEAYRARQLRAVTLDDYADRAGEVDGVSRAAARYAWTGSWRTVQVTIDPAGRTRLAPDLRERVRRHLESVRLIGEDIEIRAPRWVPLDIEVVVCIDAAFWLNDTRFVIEQAFSDGIDRDGRKAFFHPDRWTFGQELHASEIEGRLDDIPGVDHVEHPDATV
jgi:predicted phage baseplate assembly protein